MMLKVKRYKLPVQYDLHDGFRSIERKHQELLQKQRAGYPLDEEELDWLDWAELTLTAA
jgi:hypothetical protein